MGVRDARTRGGKSARADLVHRVDRREVEQHARPGGARGSRRRGVAVAARRARVARDKGVELGVERAAVTRGSYI